MKKYPNPKGSKLEDVLDVLKQICSFRNEDVNEYNNLNKVLIRGRLTARVPSASNDVVTGDLVGDFNPQADYLYILVANGGTPAWRRITAAAW